MRPGTNVFDNAPEHLRFHYRFLLLKRIESNWNRGKRITVKENWAFIDFIRIMYDDADWRLQTPGNQVMHIWTRDDDWEMVARLSERFDDHFYHMTKTCRD